MVLLMAGIRLGDKWLTKRARRSGMADGSNVPHLFHVRNMFFCPLGVKPWPKLNWGVSKTDDQPVPTAL